MARRRSAPLRLVPCTRPRAPARVGRAARRARSPVAGTRRRQAPGHRPATLACALERERGAPSSRREALALAHELAAWLAANVVEQVRALDARGLDALMVVDEAGR